MDGIDFVAGAADEGTRLDVFTAQSLNLSRSHVQAYIEEGRVQVNLCPVPKSYKVKSGDVITCVIPQPELYEAVPEDIPLDVVYEDGDLIVVNKAQGMVVHPAPGHLKGTLVNALLHHCRDLSGVNGVLRPGIVHRLDKDTSGLIVVAKHDKAHHGLAAQLAMRTMGRVYYALVHGLVEADKLRIEKNIGRHPADRKKMTVLPSGKGKTAITHFAVIKRFKAHTLLEARLETGRTHQIRVHLEYIGHPVFCDPVYGPKNKNIKDAITSSRQLLHAKSLNLTHPITGEAMHFDSALPQHFIEAIDHFDKY